MDAFGATFLLVKQTISFLRGNNVLMGPKFFVLSLKVSLIQESIKRGSAVLVSIG